MHNCSLFDISGTRLAVTGMALRNALGNTPDAIWQNAVNMRSGLALVTPGPNDPPGLLADFASFVPGTNSYCDVIARMDHGVTRQDLGAPPQDFRIMSASTRITLLLAGQAVEQAGLAHADYAPERVGVFISQNSGESASTLWGLNLTVHADWILQCLEQETQLSPQQRAHLRARLLEGRIGPDEGSLLCRLNCTAAGFICQRYGFAGPSYSLGAACSSSLAALYSALTLIRSGVIDAAVVGGSEEVYSPLPLVEFSALGALARRTDTLSDPGQCSRPFDAQRNGFVLGEGAAMIVVEREDLARNRQAEIFGLVSACACTTNTLGPVEASADAQIQTINASFAGLPYGPAEVDLVECHATGTPQGDTEELLALKAVYTDGSASGPVLAAFKAQVGHSLGASGLSALIRGLLAIRHTTFPGTLNFETPDPELDGQTRLRVLSVPQPWPVPASGIRRLQVDAFGFGGSCVVVQLEEENALSAQNRRRAPAPAEHALRETEVDGVSLLTLSHQGMDWRLGSINMSWRQELAGMPPDPGTEELAALGKRGVWLHRDDQPPPIALVCCGQGSVYPGMGRELYDSFPLVREAMDRLASKADWDLLGLMDEADMEKIVLTRWQQPYLLLLEYAQFHYLQSLGLRPGVIAGHSLGELIALCLAGAYTPEGAWHILDGRSKVMDKLEKSTQRDTGMMAVHAPQAAIDDCLAQFPSLLVSNYNTPTQFILSGPKTDLQEASRALRKRRLPAMQLNVSLAFHHPGMRVVREFSLNGLRDVPMQGTRTPMLSNVTTGLYPDDEEGIREYILNLDENPVRWVECVHVMWRQFKARHFLELGPTNTLCGLIGDIRPEALCIAAGRKGKEAEQLRTVVARLHALGHLPGACAPAPPLNFSMHIPQSARPLLRPKPAPSSAGRASAPDAAPRAQGSHPDYVDELIPILVEVTGFTPQELQPDMDLRHDLSLRSSRFPLIMHEVEKCFGLTLRFDDLLGVATIRDLAGRIHELRRTRSRQTPGDASRIVEDAEDSAPHPEKAALPPLLRYGSRQAPFTPPDGPALPAKKLLAAGRSALAGPALAFLRSRYGESRVTYCPEPAEALDIASQDTFDFLVLLPESPSGVPADPSRELHDFFLLLQTFLRRREARFCLLAGTGAEQAEDALHRGITGILLAAALEYQNVLFRSVWLHDSARPDAPAAQDWLAPALVPDQTFGQTPLQWIWNNGTWLSPQILPLPFDPGLEPDDGKGLRPGDVIVVSGGARGITPHILRECAALGCKLILLGRSEAPREDTLEELERLGASVEYHVCDAGDAEAVRRVLRSAHAAHGRIDGIIHAAGVTRDAQIDSLSPEQFMDCLHPKCRGALYLVGEALPLGLRYVAAFSSIAALCGNLGQANYCAANQTMCALLRGLCRNRAALHLLWLPPVSDSGMTGDAAMREAMRLRGMDKAFCRMDELSYMLVRELACARETDVIPARILPAIPTLLPPLEARTHPERLGIAPQPEAFPLLLPESCAPGEDATLDASCHFSHFRELWLPDARPWPDSPHPCLPPSIQLASLFEGAAQLFPWIAPVGAEALSFSTAECPPGLTREGLVHCRASRAQRGQRLCRGELLLRDYAPNGRAKHSFSPICSARMLLAPAPPKMPAPLPPDPAAAPVSATAAPAGPGTLQNFYARQTGLGPGFRLLTALDVLEEKRLLARMRIPSKTNIAGLKNSGYMYPAYAFEAAIQAALLLALMRSSEQGTRSRLALARVDAVYFSRNCAPDETLGLELRENVDGASGRRFDAELRDVHGHTVLALRGICLAE